MCNCQNNLPEFDMDGTRFHGEPCDDCLAAYEAEQKQSGEWANAGKCQGCGAENPLTTGFCETCMNAYCSAMASVCHQD